MVKKLKLYNYGTSITFSLTFPIGEPDIHDLTCQQGRTVLDKKDIRISEAKDDQFKILIVEDDQELRSYIKKILEETYLIIECTNGQQGLAFLQQEIPENRSLREFAGLLWALYLPLL